MFKTATLLHALLHPSEEGGSAAGVLITDKYLKPCGDAGQHLDLRKVAETTALPDAATAARHSGA